MRAQNPVSRGAAPQKHVGPEYEAITASLWQIRLVVFVRRRLMPVVSNVQVRAVRAFALALPHTADLACLVRRGTRAPRAWPT